MQLITEHECIKKNFYLLGCHLTTWLQTNITTLYNETLTLLGILVLESKMTWLWLEMIIFRTKSFYYLTVTLMVTILTLHMQLLTSPQMVASARSACMNKLTMGMFLGRGQSWRVCSSRALHDSHHISIMHIRTDHVIILG